MNTLIVYFTKHGAAQKIAEGLAAQLENATLCNGKKEPIPALKDFDRVVVGSSLYAGSIGKEVKAFLTERAQELGEKPLGLFLSGLDATGEERYFAANFPQSLLTRAKAKAFLGGAYDPAQCAFGERFVMKLLGKNQAVSTISHEDIQRFADALKG